MKDRKKKIKKTKWEKWIEEKKLNWKIRKKMKFSKWKMKENKREKKNK